MAPRTGRMSESARRTAIPAVPSWMAMSGGVPSRPAGAVTTPRMETRPPIAAWRASAIAITGLAVGVGLGDGVGVGVATGVGVGLPVGDADGIDVGIGVAVGPGW